MAYSSSKNVLLFLPSKNFNDEEYLTISQTLKKSGFSIFIASDTVWMCEGINGLKVKPDMNILNIHENNFAGLILSGGSGARSYWNNALLHSVVKKFFQAKKIVSAICSAPVIFAKAGILKDVSSTCFFEDRTELINAGADYKDTPVVVRKNIITANGPKASQEFIDAVIGRINEKQDD